jgi:alkanesulfonate monooxygenase SsuD/methylene tetrahydromethanopterin reductase-like flavin-dependent oxidoreductase (luciferase family)
MVASAATPSGWVTHPWVEESAAEVRFGIGNGPRGDWSALSEFVAALEELGFDGYWSSDHPVLSPAVGRPSPRLPPARGRSVSAHW